MNSKKSLVVFAIGIVWLAVVVYGFARGAEVLGWAKLAWMGGSLAFAALGVWISTKVNK